MKRKKRLKKGIESLRIQRDLHIEKRRIAEEEGNKGRVAYYDKELYQIDYKIADKKSKLDKS